jgi:hypothetical protein
LAALACQRTHHGVVLASGTVARLRAARRGQVLP